MKGGVMNDGSVVVEVVHIAECPNWSDTAEDIRDVLVELGHAEIPVRIRRVESGEEALSRGFAGSPTILINGVDPYPHGEPTSDLACRVYVTENGLRGRPSRSQLRQVLVAHGAGITS